MDAVQRHSRGAPTVAVPVPPFGPKAAVGADTVVWHRGTTLGLVALDTLELPHPTPATVANAHHATAASARGAMRRPVAQSSPMLRLSQHPRHAKRPSAASVCRHDVPIVVRALEERHGQARRCAVYGRRVGRDLCGTGAQHVLKTARQERTQPVLRSQRRPTSDKSLPSSQSSSDLPSSRARRARFGAVCPGHAAKTGGVRVAYVQRAVGLSGAIPAPQPRSGANPSGQSLQCGRLAVWVISLNSAAARASDGCHSLRDNMTAYS